MSTRVHCLGFRGVGSQVDRIEQGFRELGWVPVDDTDAEFIYVNDGGRYDHVIQAKREGLVYGPVIFNCLDLAPHLGASFPLARVKEQLSHADAVTAISTFVQQDLRTRAEVEATVIYNPIRPVGYLAGVRATNLEPVTTGEFDPFVKRGLRIVSHYPFRAMFVGRVGDPFKRAALGASALAILGFGWEDVVTVGREQPSYGGTYLGEASDDVLNLLYNSVDFVMFPSGANEGLGLPMVEAMACGAIPVVCNDLCTRQEFLPSSVFPEYDEVEPNAPSIARFVSRFMQDNDAKAEFSARLYRHYLTHWQERLSPKGVASAILRVYEAL